MDFIRRRAWFSDGRKAVALLCSFFFLFFFFFYRVEMASCIVLLAGLGFPGLEGWIHFRDELMDPL